MKVPNPGSTTAAAWPYSDTFELTELMFLAAVSLIPMTSEAIFFRFKLILFVG
jgi:hypothetical protein